jgi:hypothetical protein
MPSQKTYQIARLYAISLRLRRFVTIELASCEELDSLERLLLESAVEECFGSCTDTSCGRYSIRSNGVIVSPLKESLFIPSQISSHRSPPIAGTVSAFRSVETALVLIPKKSARSLPFMRCRAMTSLNFQRIKVLPLYTTFLLYYCFYIYCITIITFIYQKTSLSYVKICFTYNIINCKIVKYKRKAIAIPARIAIAVACLRHVAFKVNPL